MARDLREFGQETEVCKRGLRPMCHRVILTEREVKLMIGTSGTQVEQIRPY